MAGSAHPERTGGFAHEALIYGSEAEFLAGTLPFIAEGIAGGEAVLALVPEPHLRMLADALGSAAGGVTFIDLRAVGRNPARIIPVWQEFVDRHDRRAVRGLGEPTWAGRSADELREWQIHESLLNEAFAGTPNLTILCPYDHTVLDDSVSREARRSHPWLRHGGIRRENGRFGDHHTDRTPFARPLPPAPAGTHVSRFGAFDLSRIRARVAALCAAAGMPRERTDDLVLAVSEIAANSIRHGGGAGTMQAWPVDGGVVCQLSDRGRLGDPLAGRRRPRANQDGGRGIWLANQLCDLVQIRVGRRGTVIRLHQQSAPAP